MRFWPLAMASTAALMALTLVVARLLAAAVVVVVLEDDLLGLPASGPSTRGTAPRVRQATGTRRARASASICWPRAGAVVEHEAVAVGGEHEGNVERRRRIQRLLHAVADGVVVVLGLDDGDGDVGLVVEDVVGALGLAARDQLAADDDAALGEADFLADLRHLVPARLLTAGVMNLVQMSRSLSDFLSSPGMCENPSQLKALAKQNTSFPLRKSPNLGG